MTMHEGINALDTGFLLEVKPCPRRFLLHKTAKNHEGISALYKEKGGAEGRNRTADTTIFSRMLYRLSYLGTEAKCILRGRAARVKTSRQ